MSGLAQAQQPPNSGTMLEEIIVTAQKRAESLQDVPVAVTALTDQTRQLIGIKSVQDITDFTPSLVYYTGVDRMTLRGIGRLTNNAGTEPGVATYVDGFYVTSNILVGVSDLFNSRVEILRGPQGTLYGRNAVGGAINTISRRPSEDVTAEVRTTVANFDRIAAEGTFSAPLGAGWAFRISASDTQQNRGYYHNIGSAPSEGGTAHDKLYDLQLQGAMGPFDVWLKYFKYQLNDTSRILNITVPYNTTVFFPATNLIPSATFGYTVQNPALTDPRAINTNTPAAFTVKGADMWIGHLTWHLDGADIKYIGGYYRYDLRLQQDSDNTSRTSYQYQPLGLTGSPSGNPVTVSANNIFDYQEFHNYYSNEINVTSTGDGPLQWIVGGYQLNEHLYEPFALSSPNQTQLYQPALGITTFVPFALNFAPGAGGAPNPLGNYVYETGLLHTKSLAGFGQLDWKIADQWKLTAGARYSKDEKTGEAVQRFFLWNPQLGTQLGLLGVPGVTSATSFDVTPAVTGYPAGTTPAIMDVKNDTDGYSGTLGTQWQPSKNTLTYLKYSRGFKAGALNLGQVSFTNPASTTVGPEKLDAIELGLKEQVSTFQINSALYFYNYHDAQVPTSVIGQGNVAVTQFVNIAKMRDYGVEVETIWQPTDALTFMLNYSYLKTKIEESVCIVDAIDPGATQPDAMPCGPPASNGSVAQSPVGSHMLGSPENKASAVISYRFHFEPGSLTLTATDSFRDKQYSFILDRPYWQTPSYNLIGARVMWTGADNSYNVNAYVTNAAEKLAADSVGASAGSTGINQAFGYLPPRTYGLEVQYRWGAK
jgi:iron complex outermembrane receptor protein